MMNNITSSKFVDDQITTCIVHHKNPYLATLSVSDSVIIFTYCYRRPRQHSSDMWWHCHWWYSVCGTDSLRFWEQNSNMRTSKLAHLAQDLICAPTSQAYVERVFSLCSILTAGRRSSMRKSLEMHV